MQNTVLVMFTQFVHCIISFFMGKLVFMLGNTSTIKKSTCTFQPAPKDDEVFSLGLRFFKKLIL